MLFHTQCFERSHYHRSTKQSETIAISLTNMVYFHKCLPSLVVVECALNGHIVGDLSMEVVVVCTNFFNQNFAWDLKNYTEYSYAITIRSSISTVSWTSWYWMHTKKCVTFFRKGDKLSDVYNNGQFHLNLFASVNLASLCILIYASKRIASSFCTHYKWYIISLIWERVLF